MKIKQFFFGFFLLIGTSMLAQGKLNGYKYVIIPKQFDFQKSQDQHQINSLIKFLFEKQGFVGLIIDDIYPTELRENPCLALQVKLVDHSTMFKTKIQLELKNCANQLVLQSPETETKEKDLKKGYHETIRKAFVSVEQENYTFSEKEVLMINQSTQLQFVKSTQQTNEKKELAVQQEIVIEKPVYTEPKYQEKVPVIAAISQPKTAINIEGIFTANLQTINIQKQGNQFIVSDAKNNVIGILYATTQNNYFIMKWLQSDDNLPKLCFLNPEGNLEIDDKEAVIIFRRKSL